MDVQTFLILPIVAIAAVYVGRRLWPRRQVTPGCEGCPQNRNRTDDYA